MIHALPALTGHRVERDSGSITIYSRVVRTVATGYRYSVLLLNDTAIGQCGRFRVLADDFTGFIGTGRYHIALETRGDIFGRTGFAGTADN
jgi:hypothetical protein